jgi:hypothetical protein
MSLQKQQHTDKIDGVSATAAESSRTLTLNVTSASSVGFGIALDWVAATSVSWKLYKSTDGGATYFRVPSISIVSGVGTVNDYSPDNAVSGDESWCVDLNVENATHCRIIVAATGGGATDLLTVTACSSSWS